MSTSVVPISRARTSSPRNVEHLFKVMCLVKGKGSARSQAVLSCWGRGRAPSSFLSCLFLRASCQEETHVLLVGSLYAELYRGSLWTVGEARV